ncbi:Kynurenine formamidase [Eumeta japonica]|uniref:Kynurenine formamidase n=1 Tax=Eumeta variegata TaxID=151549 RepID=A0A4C1SU96_EUMVA|nr:Kynurenine formamidase [Eumeta japonica]
MATMPVALTLISLLFSCSNTKGDQVKLNEVLFNGAYEFIDLTHHFDNDTVYWPTVRNFAFTQQTATNRQDGSWYATNDFAASEHGGTHIDAPYHFISDGQRVGDIPLDKLIVPLIIADVSSNVNDNPNFVLYKSHLDYLLNDNLGKPCVVIFKFGWSKYFDDKNKYLGINPFNDTLNFPVTNTSKFNGVIRLFERRLQRPLQWIICMLHLNELPLRHLFDYLDGKISGPFTYNGPIGKLLDKCETRAVVEFESIPGQLPTLKPDDLSTDQKYLFEINLAVITGSCADDLANKSPGKMSHARWLTKAKQILRLYISTPTPSTNLIILAQYIAKVYTPVWFQIKTHSSCKDGSRHLWKLIESSRFLSSALKAVIDPVIQRNAYFAHPENLLLMMLTDGEKHIRELAARRILKIRSSPTTGKLPRTFEVPELNFDAKSYIDLINWQETNFDPPILKNKTNDELIQIIEKKGDETMLFLRLPCHTQAVERSVKIVTEAAMSACDKKARDGIIHAKLASRKAMPKFDSLSVEVAEWITTSYKNIVGVGVDVASVDPGSSTDFAVHKILLKAGLYNIENANLYTPIPEYGCTALVLPMKIRFGTGAPLRLVAICPKQIPVNFQ